MPDTSAAGAPKPAAATASAPRDEARTVEIAGLHICEYRELDTLPAGYTELFEAEGRRNLHWSRSWLGAVIRHSESLDRTPLLLGVEDAAGIPLALSVGFSTAHYGEARRCRGLTMQIGDEPYRPLVVAGLSPVDVLRMVARHARRSHPPYDVLRISPLDVNGELFEHLPSVLRAEGWIRQRFLMFPNWYEDVSGRDAAEYLRARPSRLRSTIERRVRSLERSGRSRIEIITGGAALDTASWNFERVFGRSWKHGLAGLPYQRTIMQVAAKAGALRLALLHVDDKPAAAQIWMVSGGIGYLHRMAYDERFRDFSPGTVLTWHVVRHLLDIDHVHELDLGVGDDAYKADWASSRRERWGILAFNPRTWAGLKAASINIGGRAAKGIVRTVLRSRARS